MTTERQAPRPRRGRPSLVEAEAIDRAILHAALACFLARGFDGTTMESIALRAGVTKTTLYLRYPDKAAVLRAVLADRRKEWGAASRKSASSMGDTLDSRLRSLARRLVERSLDDDVRSFVKLIDSLYGSSEVVAEEYLHLLRRPMLERIAGEISEYAAKDGVPARDPEAAAAIFLGMLSGYLLMRRQHDAAHLEGAASFADYAVDIFLMGRASW